jgi:hypothetical protein
MAVGKANFGGNPVITATDTICYSLDTEGNGNYGSYTKVRDVDVRIGGTYRVKFDIRVSTVGQTVYGRIYVNGVAVGTERSSDTNYNTFTQDIRVVIGDNIQLYVRNTGSGNLSYYKNFRVCSNLFTTVL